MTECLRVTCIFYPSDRGVLRWAKQAEDVSGCLDWVGESSKLLRMIFTRALIKEFADMAIAVFVALFAVLLTTLAIRLLGQAAGGRIDPGIVLALLGFGAINYLPVLLSLTLFIAVLMTLSRSYRDSEMIVWFSAGVPLTRWLSPVLVFAAPVVVLIAVLSVFLSPWAQGKAAEFRKLSDARDDVARVSPGTFGESGGGNRVFFVEAVSGEEGLVRNVFVSMVQHGRLGVMVSARGRQETMPNGDRFLVLESGRRYEGTPGTPEYRVMEFERYAVRLESRGVVAADQEPRNMPITQLLRDPVPVHQGEILWRMGLPIGALMLSLLAIPLSFVNPRASRGSNLMLALATYMLYSNLISVSQAWVAQGRMSFGLGVWGVHALMLTLLVVLFYKRIAIFAGLSLRR